MLHITIRYGKMLYLRTTFDPDLPQVNVLFVVFTFAGIVNIITNVKIKTVFQRIFLSQIKKIRTLPSASTRKGIRKIRISAAFKT